MPVLTLVDVTGIQRFVFGSSRLRQVVGASALLQEATGASLDETDSHETPKGWPNLLGYKEQVIASGGGNILLRFSDMVEAREFAAKLSRCALRYVPELEMVIVHQCYELGKIGKAIHEIYAESMPQAKAEFIPRGLVLNLGITEECFETGQIACDYDKEDNAVSFPTILKDNCGRNPVYFDRLLKPHEREEVSFRFPLNLDDLGRSLTESSLIGIIHMDANNTGQHFSSWIEDNSHLPDDDFVRKYSEISRGLSQAVKQTLEAIVTRVVYSIHPSIAKEKHSYILRGRQGDFVLYEGKGKDGKREVYLPMRPIIAAGEDITFVCDGRIALDLAAFAIQEFERQAIPEFGNLTMSAGVSIVHAHSPFLRAYETAEQLCSNAKKRARNYDNFRRQPTSAVDWHISPSGTIQPISEIREEMRALDGKSLTMRPYLLNQTAETGTWQWFNENILLGKHGFLSSNWASHKSKANALRHLATRGQHEIHKSLNNWKVTASDVALPEVLRDNDGFVSPPPGTKELATPIIDALELLGLYISLEEGES